MECFTTQLPSRFYIPSISQSMFPHNGFSDEWAGFDDCALTDSSQSSDYPIDDLPKGQDAIYFDGWMSPDSPQLSVSDDWTPLSPFTPSPSPSRSPSPRSRSPSPKRKQRQTRTTDASPTKESSAPQPKKSVPSSSQDAAASSTQKKSPKRARAVLPLKERNKLAAAKYRQRGRDKVAEQEVILWRLQQELASLSEINRKLVAENEDLQKRVNGTICRPSRSGNKSDMF